MVDRGAEGGDFGVVGMQLDPSVQASADRYALQLVRKLLHRPHFTALEPIQHQKERCDEREQQAHKAENRHLYSLAGPAVNAHRPGTACHLVVRMRCAGSISHDTPRSARISLYLVARTLGSVAENP